LKIFALSEGGINIAMKTSHWPVPNMKGKKFYRFRCGCCSAQNKREELREKEIARLTDEEINE